MEQGGVGKSAALWAAWNTASNDSFGTLAAMPGQVRTAYSSAE